MPYTRKECLRIEKMKTGRLTFEQYSGASEIFVYVIWNNISTCIKVLKVAHQTLYYNSISDREKYDVKANMQAVYENLAT